jgi:O-antigen ligase
MSRTLLSALLLLIVGIVLSRDAAWQPLLNEVSAGQAFAYHPNRSGSASIGAVLPIAVGAVLVVAGVVFWGRKKRKTKSKRRKRRN